MKKILLILLILLVLCGCSDNKENKNQPFDSPDDPTEEVQGPHVIPEEYEYLYVEEREIPSALEPIESSLEFYPFIYNEFYSQDPTIGPCKGQIGYLYSKELATGIIRQLISKPVNMISGPTHGEYVYFITDNIFGKVDHLGEKIEVLYVSEKQLNNNNLSYYKEYWTFTENGLVKIYNENTKEIIDVIDIKDYGHLMLKDQNTIIYGDETIRYKYNYVTQELESFTEEEWLDLYSTKIK